MTTYRTHRSAFVLIFAIACGGFRAKLKQGEIYLERENGSAAIRVYQKALEARPGHPKAELGMARALIIEGEPGGAIELARSALASGHEDAPEVLSIALLENGQGPEALPVIELSLLNQSKEPHLHLIQAEALLSAGHLDRAVSAAERAFELGGGPRAGSLAGWIHTRLGSCSRARSMALRASAISYDDVQIQAEAASIFRICGDDSNLKTTSTTARTLMMDDGEDWIDSAIRRGNGTDQEGALRRLGWLRAMYPDDGIVAKEMGLLWSHLGDHALALEELELSLTLPPLSSEKGSKAIRVANRRVDQMDATEKREAISSIWDEIIGIHKARNDKMGVAGAMESQLAARLDKAPEDYVVVSQAWERAGAYDQAVSACLKAVKQTTNHVEAHTQCARMYAKLGDLKSAVGHARVAFEQRPSDADLTVLLGQLHLAGYNRREARRVFSIGVRHHPDDPRMQEGLREARGYGK
jgi:tetratricopeptide (TPR) repeat protein